MHVFVQSEELFFKAIPLTQLGLPEDSAEFSSSYHPFDPRMGVVIPGEGLTRFLHNFVKQKSHWGCHWGEDGGYNSGRIFSDSAEGVGYFED